LRLNFFIRVFRKNKEKLIEKEEENNNHLKRSKKNISENLFKYQNQIKLKLNF